MLLTSVIFFLYDSCVRREFMIKKDLLESKRRFMRFVSHEVRTPLNAVRMGLNVLWHEMKTSPTEGDTIEGANESPPGQTVRAPK
jgi:signal transduction histidine kinase